MDSLIGLVTADILICPTRKSMSIYILLKCPSKYTAFLKLKHLNRIQTSVISLLTFLLPHVKRQKGPLSSSGIMKVMFITKIPYSIPCCCSFSLSIKADKMDRISVCSWGEESVWFEDLKITCLIVSDNMVLLASSDHDLQHTLGVVWIKWSVRSNQSSE